LRGGARGDQYVTVHVAVPTGLNAEQKDLLHRFEISGANAGQSAGGGASGNREGKKRKRGK
jgi:DnaJ-class molecular chaperone